MINHFVLKNYYYLVGLCITLLSLFLRIYLLGTVPAGLSVDEASTGYNAFAIATQHRDEWLIKMPISFKSFGEYKPAVSIYIIALLTKIFGPSEFIIRFPAAMAGVLTTVSTFFLAYKIFTRKPMYALAVMALVAVSPLSIHFSRIGFESSMGVATVLIGATFFIWAKDMNYLRKLLFYVFAGISWAISFHANQTTKIFLPIFILTFLWNEKDFLRKNLKEIILCFLIVGLGVLLFFSQLNKNGVIKRLSMTSAFVDVNGVKPPFEIARVTIHNLLQHLNPDFLFFGQTDNYRHGNGIYGIFSFIEGLLFLIGTYFIIKSPSLRKSYGWLVILFFVALIPGVISQPSPHANRIHHLIPWAQLIAGVGLIQIIERVRNNQKIIIWRLFVGVLALQLMWQIAQYYQVYSVIAAPDFQYGYKEAVAYAVQYESSVDEIFITDYYTQPYIYTLLYKKVLPISYHQGGLIKYRFRPTDFDFLSSKKNVLVIAAPSEIPNTTKLLPTHVIEYPDGKPVFFVYLIK
ncbi:MAG: glycosyltransferase family 39 protein [Candidatus Pacebacteria bacterium]|nr:glycosyltransferase family 39 protein [Candidatus Paceibacterota bacterium]